MTLREPTVPKRVAVVGGGLAGLSAAAGLADRGLHVEIFEARRRLGGRASSFQDSTGKWVDHCQHVGMGCCTNLLAFCRRTQISDLLRRERVIPFIGPTGQRCNLNAAAWLPCPFHLTPSLLGMRFLTWRERFAVARTLLQLARTPIQGAANEPTIGQWLDDHKQSRNVQNKFWSVVLVSALGESLSRASLSAARKVFVDGFLGSRHAYEILVPKVPLSELYGSRILDWFAQRNVQVHLSNQVTSVRPIGDAGCEITIGQGLTRRFDYVVLASHWRRIPNLLEENILEQSGCHALAQLKSAPITGLHLWFDRRITSVRHAVIVDRLIQWVFYRGGENRSGDLADHGEYYQVVISASHDLAGQDHEEILRRCRLDLESIWPGTAEAELKGWKLITERDAVFSVQPGIERLRPLQQTSIPSLLLAGDWTRTGWPATMEGAVRSGYLAAESILRENGLPAGLVVPDLKRSLLSRLLISSTDRNSRSEELSHSDVVRT